MDSAVVRLEYATPAEELREFISSYYLFDYPLPDFRESERADRPQLRFRFRGSGGYSFHDGHVARAHRVTILGPTTGPSEGFSTSPLTIFGAGLQPAGWAAMMGADAPNHVDRLLDAKRVFGDGILALREQLMAAGTIGAMAAIMDEVAGGIVGRADRDAIEFTRHVDAWLCSGSSPALADLIGATGLSQRHVERLTQRYYGMAPKLLARKYRALRAASALARGETADEASDGFYDQSHLIREVKKFTGITPGEMRGNAPMLTAATIGGRQSLAGKVSPLISET